MYKIIIQKDGKEINSFETVEFFIGALGPDNQAASVIAKCCPEFLMQTMVALLDGLENVQVITGEEFSKINDIFKPGAAKKTARLRVLGVKDREDN